MPVNTCGVGGWGGPLPGDPGNASLLTASPRFGGIQLSWNLPSTNPFAVAYVRIFRSFNSSFVTAIQIAEAAGGSHFDSTETIQLHYYWIQLISINGTDGAVIGPASATPMSMVGEMLERLSGLINASTLSTDLRGSIDRISLNESAILAEANARIAGNTAYQAMLAQLQTGVADALTLVNTEVTQRTNGDSALASVLTTVAAANVNNAALIQEETLARVSADSAIASQYTLLNAQVNNATTGLPATRSLLMNDYYTEAQVDFAIASATLNLVTQTGLTTSLSSYTTTAALQVAYYTKTQTDSAISSASTTLQSSINSNQTTAMNAANAAQTSANTANSLLADISSDSLLTPSEKPDVVKEYNILIGEQTGISAQATSYGVTTEATAYTTALSALTTYLNGLTGWNVIPGTNVTIVGTTFRTNFQNVYAARQALLNAILAASKTLTGTAQTTANNAATAASTAQTAANTANTAHTNLASDNILSPSEKPSVVQDHGVIIAEQAGITAQATSYGITTELTAYTNAVSALVSYLGGLTGWNTVPGVDVVIVGTTFRTQFSNVYTTRQAVLNAIAARAKVLADNAQTAANNAQGTANTVTSTLSNSYTTTVGMNSAISSAITTLESSVDGDLVQLQSSLTTNIGNVQTDLNGVKSNLNAKYLLQLNVNGLIGGMAIYNSGSSVDVGFNCTNFYVGTTQANKKIPFIVTGGNVFIDNAFITNLTADKIDTRGLDIRDAFGNIIFSSGTSKTSANMLTNSDFFQSADYWQIGFVQNGGTNYQFLRNLAGPPYVPAGSNQAGLFRTGDALTGSIDFYNNRPCPAVPGKRYELSAYLAAHRCNNWLILGFFNSAGTALLYVEGPQGRALGDGSTLSSWRHTGVFGVAPAGTTNILVFVRTSGIDGGQPNGYSWGTQFYLGEATASQTQFAPWSPGPNGFYGQLNADHTTWAAASSNSGGPLHAPTYIQAASIDSLRVAGNAVTTLDGESAAVNWVMNGTTNGTIQNYAGFVYLYSPITASQGVFLTFSANVNPVNPSECFVQFERSNNNGASWSVIHQRVLGLIGGYGTTISVPYHDLPGQGNFVYRVGVGNSYIGSSQYTMSYWTLVGVMSIR